MVDILPPVPSLQVKKQTVSLPGGGSWNLERLLAWIRDNLLKDRPELFMKDNTVTCTCTICTTCTYTCTCTCTCTCT